MGDFFAYVDDLHLELLSLREASRLRDRMGFGVVRRAPVQTEEYKAALDKWLSSRWLWLARLRKRRLERITKYKFHWFPR